MSLGLVFGGVRDQNRAVAMDKRIRELLLTVGAAEKEAGAYAFLPDIANILEQMLEDIRAPEDVRTRLSRGLIRIVTDNYSFSESPLGRDLLDASGAFALRQLTLER